MEMFSEMNVRGWGFVHEGLCTFLRYNEAWLQWEGDEKAVSKAIS